MHTHVCTFGADLYAQSVIINKISASELSRKFIKSALLVGEGSSCRKDVRPYWKRKRRRREKDLLSLPHSLFKEFLGKRLTGDRRSLTVSHDMLPF